MSSQRPQGSGPRQPRMFMTGVDLPEETRRTVVGMLNQSLADTTDLTTQLKYAHWNVKGINFYQLHLLFDEIAEVLEEHADTIAERATALGGEATGTARMAAANTRIPEIPTDATTGPEYLEALVERVSIHASNLRRDIELAVEYDDEDTADLYTELSREVDKQLYFLQSHLQDQSAVEGTARVGAPAVADPTGQSASASPPASNGGRTQGSAPSQYGRPITSRYGSQPTRR
ncbi:MULTISPECIES: DNA starvation/stationary phase protection protein Dps [Halorussus]|uniref:DNA starvation/stationary phase protection protein Dps n=1 Tax=Halorussus TaxID=1070314 RepID=UPI00209CF496|nr:DNA starvation/stationary phase protection protein Dps [Halorussus vallis]USZ73917.1 DNA starvation/stationary phase protection protein Dps [Halorussus vallis]